MRAPSSIRDAKPVKYVIIRMQLLSHFYPIRSALRARQSPLKARRQYHQAPITTQPKAHHTDNLPQRPPPPSHPPRGSVWHTPKSHRCTARDPEQATPNPKQPRIEKNLARPLPQKLVPLNQLNFFNHRVKYYVCQCFKIRGYSDTAIYWLLGVLDARVSQKMPCKSQPAQVLSISSSGTCQEPLV